MLMRVMQVHFKLRREDAGRTSDLVAVERAALLCVYLVGGLLWGLLTGATVGWILSRATTVPFSAGFIFGVLPPVLLRAGRWLSGSILGDTNDYLRDTANGRATTP